MSENCVLIERLCNIFRNLGLTYATRDGKLLTITPVRRDDLSKPTTRNARLLQEARPVRRDDLPKPTTCVFEGRDEKIVAYAWTEGFRFDGARRVEGLRFCNDWNSATLDRPRAYLDSEGDLRGVASLFVDKSTSDEYLATWFVWFFLSSARQIYKDAAEKFSYLPLATKLRLVDNIGGGSDVETSSDRRLKITGERGVMEVGGDEEAARDSNALKMNNIVVGFKMKK